MFGNRSLPRILLIAWLAFLLIAALAAHFLAGETDISVNKDGARIWAEVRGTQLDVPTSTLQLDQLAQIKLPSLAELKIEPPSSSLYWQPAQQNTFYAIGVAGEWLQQTLRPPSEWVSARVTYQSGNYKLTAGRALALVPLESSPGNGVVLLVRPERSLIQWWTLENGQPQDQLVDTNYRPSGFVSAGDLLSEVALIALAAGLLCMFAWLVVVFLVAIYRRSIGPLSATNAFRSPLIGANLDTTPSTSATTPTDDAQVQSRSSVLMRIRPSYVALAFFALGTAITSGACLLVLDGIPHVQDSVAYLFQGKIFAHLTSWAPEPPSPEFFQNSYIEFFQGRWFTKYPPGYPLMLTLGVWAGLPWLINALSAGAALAFIYATGLRMFNTHVAMWAALFGLISPWVIFMSGSYMSHPTTMMWVALFIYGLVQLRLSYAQAKPSRFLTTPSRWGLLSGFAIGMAFITREWTALGIGVGAAIWGIGDIASAGRRALRKLVPYIMMVAGFVPPFLFLLFENHELTGDWFLLPQDLVGSYDQPGFGPGHGSEIGHTPAMGLYNALVYLRTLAMVFNGWPAPFALAPIFLGLFAWIIDRRDKLAWDLLLWLSLAGLLVAYFAWWSSTTIFGPRYWYEGMPFLLLMAGRGMDLLGRAAAHLFSGIWAQRVRWVVPATILVLFSLYTLTQTMPEQVQEYTNYNDVSAESVNAVSKAGLTNALIFVALDPDQKNRDYGKVFFANDPFLEGNIVYVRDLGLDANTYYASLYPSRQPYYLPLTGPPKPGVSP